MKNKNLLIYIIMGIALATLIYFLLGAQPTNENNVPPDTKMEYHFPFSLKQPDQTFSLPDYLREVSGLCYYDANEILCVQDESAIIYKFNLKKGEVTKKYNYKKNGDFEGIAVTGKTAWLLESDGTLYKIDDFKEKNFRLEKIKTALSSKNDCEGLCYDPKSNSLLIACKGSPSIDEKDKTDSYKAIYRFDLKKMKLIKKPYLLIDLKQIKNIEEGSKYDKISHKITSFVDESGDIRFQPSGIAIHPINKQLFVIASVGSSLVVFDKKSAIVCIKKLNKKTFRQPEGICFDLNGKLFIANEGDGGKAKLYKFVPEK